MSEIIPLSLIPAPAKPTVWIDLEQASKLSGKSVGHLRRLCGEQWAGENFAKVVTTDPGKKPYWVVSTQADPAFSLVVRESTAIVPVKVESLARSGKGGIAARERAAILVRWEEKLRVAIVNNFPSESATKAFLYELAKEFAGTNRQIPSRTTLYAWKKKASDAGGIEGLIDGRSRHRDQLAASRHNDPFLACVKQIWATQNGRGLPVCYQAAVFLARQNGWEIQSPSITRRFIEAIDRREVILKRKGKEAFVNEAKPHHQRDYTTGESNDMWVSDHHQFDVWVKVGMRNDPRTGQAKAIFARPWLTVWLDMRSRKVMARVIRATDPNTDVILEALCVGCLSHYLPSSVYTDNGKDYDSQVLTGETKKQRHERLKQGGNDLQLEGIYAALEITHHRALPYHPQSKPVERFFGTVCSRFSKLFETYCGNSPENRPEGVEERRDAGKGPDLPEFISLFDQWLEADYHQRVHSGQGMDDTPANVWAQNLQTRRSAPREVLELLMQPRYEVKVDQLGVRHDKLTYGRYVLNMYLGQRLYIRINHADRSSVSVWDVDNAFLCFAPCNEALPMNTSSADLREAQRALASFTKKMRESWQSPLQLTRDVPTLLLASAAQKASAQGLDRPALPAADTPFLPLRTNLEASVQGLHNAREQAQLPPAAPSIDAALDAYGQED